MRAALAAAGVIATALGPGICRAQSDEAGVGLAGPALISGSVLGSDARPASGVKVQVLGPAGPACRTITDGDGNFQLPCGARGQVQIRASRAARASGGEQ